MDREIAENENINVFRELAVEMGNMTNDEKLFYLTNMSEEERMFYLKRLFKHWCRFWDFQESS